MDAPVNPVIVAQVTARVREKLPQVGSDSIATEVTEVFAQYAGSKVRDFVPILVEREVVDRLRPVTTHQVA